MDQEKIIEQVMAEVLKNLKLTEQTAPSSSNKCAEKVTVADYPLSKKRLDSIKTPTGKKLSEMSLDKVISGEITAEDTRISPETLEMQAQVAESVNRDAFAGNMRRAAELIAVPDDRLLQIYEALRPYRSTKQELLAIADELETKYCCIINANFVREAAHIYENRGRLKK